MAQKTPVMQSKRDNNRNLPEEITPTTSTDTVASAPLFASIPTEVEYANVDNHFIAINKLKQFVKETEKSKERLAEEFKVRIGIFFLWSYCILQCLFCEIDMYKTTKEDFCSVLLNGFDSLA
jgi:hypothetical protein